MPDLVTLTRREYKDLIDSRDAALGLCAVAAGAVETLSSAELDA